MGEPSNPSSCAYLPAWRRAIGPLVFLVVALAIFGTVIHVLEQPSDGRPPPRMINLRQIGRAMMVYRNDHGSWPYSEAGPEAALYLLHDALPASAFDVPGRPSESGPARYDDTGKRLVNSGYLYLNPSPKAQNVPSRQWAATCIVVERQASDQGGVYAFYGDGHHEHITLPRNAGPADLLGKTWSETSPDSEPRQKQEPPRRAEQSAAAVPGIADVDSLAALEKVAPIQAGSEWKVRLGLGEAGRDAGPWKLLYCLAEYVGKGEKQEVGRRADGTELGPLVFTVTPVGQVRMKILEAKSEGMSKLQRRGLYLNRVLLADKGEYDLRVLAADGTLVAERRLAVTEVRPCPWQSFGEPVQHELRQQEGHLYEAWLGLGEKAALPRYSGLSSLLSPDRVVKIEQDDPLPGQLPGRSMLDQELWGGPGRKPQKIGEEAHGLKLSLDGEVLTIRCGAKLLDWPDRNLLVRWWLNGKAVEPERATTFTLEELQRKIVTTDSMRVRLRLAGDKFKVGDKLAVQVLYTLHGWEPLMVNGNKEMLMHLATFSQHPAVIPMTSNRLEIEVTEKLLGNPNG